MSNKKTLTGAQVLLKSFQDSGINLLAGYIGGAIMPTFDEFKNFPSLRFITCRHEQGAGFLAQGYTRACGKLVPVLVTSGPGATNLITPVADTMMDSIPFLAITGQVATTVVGSDAFQESDVVGMMYPITKYAKMPISADEIAITVGQMIYIATHGRTGPVCIDLPKNVQTQETLNITIPADLDLPGVTGNQQIETQEDNINQAIQLIFSSKRPVALVGHGVILSGAEKEIKAFVEKTQIPVAFTLLGLSALSSSNPLSMGMMGMHGEVEANRAINEADLIIALGMRFDDRVTGKLDEYAKNAKVIHIEVDPSEINKNVRVDVALLADLKLALSELTKKIPVLSNIQNNIRQEWLARIEVNKRVSKKYYSKVFDHGYGQHGGLLMTRIVHELAQFTGGMDNIVTDVGQQQMQTAKFSKFERFNTWFTSGGLGTMGFGIPTAMGVKLARPKEEVWCVVGDGGIQMNIQELGTILQEGLNINILLFNNGHLGMVKQWQDMFHSQNFSQVTMISPNFEKLTEAYGVEYQKVEKVEEIIPALEWSKQQQKTTLVEFICDKQEIVYPMIPSGWSFEKMILNETHALEVLKK